MIVSKPGTRFGRWTLIKIAIHPGGHQTNCKWLIRCDCGTERIQPLRNLRRGSSLSCGCLHSEIMRRLKPNLIHGAATRKKGLTAEYVTWQSMKTRCTNPRHEDWKYYGGRKIKVCTQWMRSFSKFFSYVGKRPSKRHTLDRIENSGNYEPGNVRWATAKEQAQTRRRPKHWRPKI